jgi:radical SAM superfamily enzyme YgiQ (UPF0313 family)
MRVLLVSPRTPETFWSFTHALPFIHRRAAHPPLGLLTVAAMLPREWDLQLVDMDAESLDDTALDRTDVVFLSSMIVQEASARAVARRCRARGIPVVAGGPLFTTGHERFPEIPHFVLGEAEEILPRLVEDLQRGRLKPTYRAERFPSLEKSPIPRWDLLELSDYATMSVQFSRGCPHDCEFCDVVVMNGHRPRTKAPARMVDELEALRRAGWRGSVFLVDDNFIGNRVQVKRLLTEMISWRRRSGARMDFITEATVLLAEDAELLELMVQAGFKKVFLGLESPDPDSLRECRKQQNTRRDLATSVHTIQAAGLEVMGGFIVGFDNDKRDVFRRQFRFIQDAGVATAMVGLLTALPRTKLHERLLREGRLLQESTGNNTQAVCNFVTRLDGDFLQEGYRRLMQRLYEPGNFYDRARTFLRHHRRRGPRPTLGRADFAALLRSLWVLGIRNRGRWAYWRFLAGTLLRRPAAFSTAVTLTIYGHHFRTVARQL